MRPEILNKVFPVKATRPNLENLPSITSFRTYIHVNGYVAASVVTEITANLYMAHAIISYGQGYTWYYLINIDKFLYPMAT